MEKEEFRDIPGHEGVYQIGSRGTIFSIRTNKVLKTYEARGYLKITLYKKGKTDKRTKSNTEKWSIHRLVAIAFIPNPDKLKVVNHKNCIRTDNSIGNLEWVSESGNTQHYLSLYKHLHVSKIAIKNMYAKNRDIPLLKFVELLMNYSPDLG